MIVLELVQLILQVRDETVRLRACLIKIVLDLVNGYGLQMQ